jgi:hypothetical protein
MSVARHERCFSRQQQVLDLEHYLDVLERKPGALSGSTALAQWRQAGRWPESFDRLWQALNMRHGRQHGTRQIIELLQLGTGEGWGRLRSAVEQALSLGCHDVAAIRHLMQAEQFDRPTVATKTCSLVRSPLRIAQASYQSTCASVAPSTKRTQPPLRWAKVNCHGWAKPARMPKSGLAAAPVQWLK